MSIHSINTLTIKDNIVPSPIKREGDKWLTVDQEDIINLPEIINNNRLALLKAQIGDSITIIRVESPCSFAKFYLRDIQQAGKRIIFSYEQSEGSGAYRCSYDLVDHKFRNHGNYIYPHYDAFYYLGIINHSAYERFIELTKTLKNLRVPITRTYATNRSIRLIPQYMY